jgi:hypothetical protein
MTDARTIPPVREGVARAIYEKRNGAGALPWGRRDGAHKAPYVGDADAALTYLRSRHLLNDIALSNLKDEEASRAGEAV